MYRYTKSWTRLGLGTLVAAATILTLLGAAPGATATAESANTTAEEAAKEATVATTTREAKLAAALPSGRLIVEGTAAQPPISPERQIGLETFAEQNGEDLADVEYRHGAAEVFTEVLDDVAAIDPDGFISGGYATADTGFPDADFVTYLLFTSEPPATVRDIVATTLPYRVALIWGLNFTQKELELATEKLAKELSTIDDIHNQFIEPNVVDGSITITYRPTETTTETTTDATTRRAETLSTVAKTVDTVASTAKTFPSVTIVSDTGASAQTTATVKGGFTLTGTESCTSGFSIQVGSTRGIVTAMHCPNSLGYEGLSGVLQYRNAASQTVTGNYIDLQWHSVLSGSSASASFRPNWGQEWAVIAATNASPGNTVCKFGFTSGYSCRQVHGLGNCYTPGNNPGGQTFCGLASTSSLSVSGGDSGGPWFDGSTVKGITSGYYTTSDGVTRDLFTPQSRIGENLGGSVLLW